MLGRFQRFVAWLSLFAFAASVMPLQHSPVPYARASTQKKKIDLREIVPHWIATPLMRQSLPEGYQKFPKGAGYEFRFVERMEFGLGKKAYPIGHVTYFKMPKSEVERGRSVSASMAEELRKGMGFKKWMQRKFGDAKRGPVADVYEAVWEQGNRYVRLYVTEDAESYAYSIAIMRMGYAYPSVLEAELIQRRLMGVIEVKIPWIERIFERVKTAAAELLAPEAWAGSCTPWPSCLAGSSSGGSSGMSDITGALSGTTSAVNGATAAVNGMSDTIDSSTRQMVRESDEWQRDFQKESDEWQTLFGSESDEWQQMLGDESQEWQDLVNATSGEWQGLATQYGDQLFGYVDQFAGYTEEGLSLAGRVVDVIEKVTSPGYAALLAGAAAASASLTGFAVNAALDGLVAGGEALIKLLSGEQRREDLLNSFIAARKLWEEQKGLEAKLEDQLEKILATLYRLKDKGMGRDAIVKAYVAELARLNAHVIQKNAVIDLNRLDVSCIQQMESEKSSIKRDMFPFLEVLCQLDPLEVEALSKRADSEIPTCKQLAEATGKDLSRVDSYGALCQQAADAYRRLAEIEPLLDEARWAIKAGAEEFVRQVEQRLEKKHKDRRIGLRQEDDVSRATRKASRREKKRTIRDIEKEFRAEKEKYVLSCMSECRLKRDVGQTTPKRSKAVQHELDRREAETERRSAKGKAPNDYPVIDFGRSSVSELTENLPPMCVDTIGKDSRDCELSDRCMGQLESVLQTCKGAQECKQATDYVLHVCQASDSCTRMIDKTVSKCVRPVKKDHWVYVEQLACIDPKSDQKYPDAIAAGSSDYGYLMGACTSKFKTEDPVGRQYAQRLWEADDAQAGTLKAAQEWDDLTKTAKKANGTLINAYASQGLLEDAQRFLNQIQKEIDGSQDKMQQRRKDAEAVEAACKDFKRQEF